QGGDALLLSSNSKEMASQPKAREKHCPHCTPKQDSSNPPSLHKVSQSWNCPSCHANQPCNRWRLCPRGRLNLLRYQNEFPFPLMFCLKSIWAVLLDTLAVGFTTPELSNKEGIA